MSATLGGDSGILACRCCPGAGEWLSQWTQCVPPLPLPDAALPGVNPLVTRS